LKFRLHFEWEDGTKDHLDIEGDSIEELKDTTYSETLKRNPDNFWSEIVKDQ
jgi:hypothetical protein